MATERVEIELALRGADGVYGDLQKLDNMLKGFSGASGKKKIELDLGQSQEKLLALRGEINETIRKIDEFRKKRDEAYTKRQGLERESEEWEQLTKDIDAASKQIDDAQTHLKEVKNEFKDVTQRVNELRYALKNFSQMSFGKLFTQISTGLKHAGQNAQTLGNALQKIGNPFQRFTSGMAMGAGFKALNLATEGLESAFDRYDTMKKYPRMMQQLGFTKSVEEGEESIKRLDKAVDGLPTPLDEIVSAAQRYTLSLGDMTKGEKLAIAANNAFLASMSSETQQYQGMMQLSDLAAGAELKATEWNSLIKSMPAAIQAVGEELGYTTDNMGDFESLLKKNKIATNEFLDALIKVGVGDDSALGKMAQLSKETFDALRRNTRSAFSRMGYNVLLALDEVSKGYNGKTVIQNLLEEKGVIDQWTASISKWIKSHPDEIIDFFKQLQSIDWGGLAKGAADGLRTVMNGYQWLIGLFDGKGMDKLGWFLAVSGSAGKAINFIGGLLKGLSHPLGLIFAAMAKIGIMSIGELEKRGGLIGMIGKLLTGGSKAAGAGKAAEEAGKVTKTLTTTAPKAADTLRNVFDSWRGALKIAGNIAIPAATAWVSIKALKSIVNDCKEIGDLVDDVNWEGAAKAIGGFGVFVGAMAGLGYVIGDASAALGSTVGLGTLKGVGIIGAITTLAAGIADLDMHLLKDTFKQFNELTLYLSASVKNLDNLKDFDKATAIDRIGQIASSMAEVYSALKVTDEEGKSLMPASGAEVKAMGDVVGGISGILSSFVEASETLKEANKTGLIDKDKALEIGGKMGGILEGLGEAFHSYLETDFGYEPSDMTRNMADTIQNFNTALTTIVGENGLIASMRKLVTQTTDIPGVQSVGSVLGSVKRFLTDEGGLFNQLKEIAKGSNDIGDTEQLQTKMHNLSVAFGSIRNVFKKMRKIEGISLKTKGKNGIGDFDAISKVKQLVSQLKSAFGENSGVDELRSNIDGFVNSISSAMDSFKKLNKDIEIKATVSLNRGWGDSVRGVKERIESDVAALKKMAKPVVIRIPVNVFYNVTTHRSRTIYNPGEVGPSLPSSTGGRISHQGVLYRSKGGSIFKPRGTDKVPAMLTEGEYVQKKQAVDFFGVDFMRKVNNLDVKGAMDALLTRAGTSIGVGRQNIVNNTVNNNQRITQNINTNNPNFAGARMGRFVGAL